MLSVRIGGMCILGQVQCTLCTAITGSASDSGLEFGTVRRPVVGSNDLVRDSRPVSQAEGSRDLPARRTATWILSDASPSEGRNGYIRHVLDRWSSTCPATSQLRLSGDGSTIMVLLFAFPLCGVVGQQSRLEYHYPHDALSVVIRILLPFFLSLSFLL